MGFHRKHGAASDLQSDVLVVSECARPDLLEKRGLRLSADSHIWVGDNPNKGLAVIVRPPYRVSASFDCSDKLPVWTFPARVTTPMGAQVDLLAVWSYWYRDDRNAFGNPVVDALARFADRISPNNLCVAGDFNTSVIWDRGTKKSNHRYTSEVLASHGLVSAYHHIGGHAYGAEPEPTIFWRDRTASGPRYHIDYIYIPLAWCDKSITASIGTYTDWVATRLSDHVPLTVNIPGIR
jgi:hypothetical protein